MATAVPAPTAPVTSTDDGGWEVRSFSDGVATTPTTTRETPHTDPPDQPDEADEPETQESAQPPAGPHASDEDDLGDDAVANGPTDPPVDGEPQPAPKRRLSARERKAQLQAEINALTRRKHELLREQAPSPRALPTEPVKTPAKADALPPPPKWKDFEAADKSWDEYQEARDQWDEQRTARLREDARAEARREAQAHVEQQQRAEREQREAQFHEDKVKRAQQAHADFHDVVKAGLTGIPPTDFMEDVVRYHRNGMEVLYGLAQQPDVAAALADLTDIDPATRKPKATNSMMQVILETEDPLPLLVHLAENPDEFSRFRALPPGPALVALTRLADRLTGAKTGSPATARVSTSKAPPPIRPTGGTRPSTASPPQSSYDLEFSPAYVAMANQEDERRGRR